MNQLLLERSTGSLSPQSLERIHSSHLLASIQHAPKVRFNGGEAPIVSGPAEGAQEEAKKIWAHASGVNALVVDRFHGRLLLSGGADASIKIWDLESITPESKTQTLTPVASISKTSDLAHKFGITALSFFPFDADAFLSTSYDHDLKLYSTNSLAVSASFNLDSIIYSHSMSQISSHLLVACATQHPAVRLVDLRSGSSAQSLAGHHGAVISVAWSTSREYVLASGGIDGTVRLWDVRKSAGTLGMLDMEDSIGLLPDGSHFGGRTRQSAKAHDAAVNGLSWTADGRYIITAGHDARVRIWDTASGSNTLASFGPTLKNGHLSYLPLLSSPDGTTRPGGELLFYPNENEILLFEMHEGRLLKRLRVPGPHTAAVRSRTGERNVRNRITALFWRGIADGFYSSHTDGQIRAWLPRTMDDEYADAGEVEEDMDRMGDDGTKRKSNVLEDVFRDLTKAKITFG